MASCDCGDALSTRVGSSGGASLGEWAVVFEAADSVPIGGAGTSAPTGGSMAVRGELMRAVLLGGHAHWQWHGFADDGKLVLKRRRVAPRHVTTATMVTADDQLPPS